MRCWVGRRKSEEYETTGMETYRRSAKNADECGDGCENGRMERVVRQKEKWEW